MERVLAFVRDHVVLCVAALAAVASMFAVPPNPGYASYIDWPTIELLACFMLCVEGLRRAGALSLLADKLLARAGSAKAVCAVLVALPFFSAMFVTNDVSLIAFVPLAIAILKGQENARLLRYTVALQAVAANMGSVITPFGNPQNLLLYETYDMGFAAFTMSLLPYWLASLCMVVIAVAIAPGGALGDVGSSSSASTSGSDSLPAGRTAAFVIAFVCGVVAVIGFLPSWAVLVIAIVVVAVADRGAAKIDYALLATFACFFVFSGNISNMPVVKGFLESVMADHPFEAALVASQVISNVPAAALLSPFCGDWAALLAGVDVGGLGTPVASLASLIALGFYTRSEGAETGRYLGVFTALNIVFLMVNILVRCFVLAQASFS